jgi:hypothetical protein
MRKGLLVVLGFVCNVISAQIVESTFPISSRTFEGTGAIESNDTIVPPFVDDFSYDRESPTPSLWTDSYVWVNNNMPLYQNSVGVATFDGCNEYGVYYDLNANNTNQIADQLTSKYLNLQGLSNVWLSFQYQRAGMGEVPTLNDSLVVQFYSPSDSSWTQVWGEKGNGNSDAFRTAMIPVVGAQYLQKGFRFKIASYGARSGAFDIWNIDYVQLDKDRNAGDSIVTEPAFARAHPLIKGSKSYTSWPWWLDMSSNPLANRPTALTFTYRRMGTVPSGGWSLNLGRYRWEENGQLIQQQTSVPVITNTLHDQDLTFDVQVPSSALGQLNGPTTVETKVWFDGSAAGLRSNDTVRGVLELDNYLALDDGSAERMYGVENVSGSRVAQKFNINGIGANDSLLGIYFNFPRSRTGFKMAVWATADSADMPGDLLYVSDSTYVSWHWYQSDLIAYAFDSALALSGHSSLWIGYIDVGTNQNVENTIYVGLDRHQSLPTSMPRYYGDGFNWYPSLEPGVLLMRPYFRYHPDDLGSVAMDNVAPGIELYPNPSEGSLNIRVPSDKPFEVHVINMNGQEVLFGEGINEFKSEADFLSKGIYTIRVVQGTQVWHAKWIKY